jgi:hypothetical protein
MLNIPVYWNTAAFGKETGWGGGGVLLAYYKLHRKELYLMGTDEKEVLCIFMKLGVLLQFSQVPDVRSIVSQLHPVQIDASFFLKFHSNSITVSEPRSSCLLSTVILVPLLTIPMHNIPPGLFIVPDVINPAIYSEGYIQWSCLLRTSKILHFPLFTLVRSTRFPWHPHLSHPI